MLSTSLLSWTPRALLVRAAAPLIWRRRSTMVRKLRGFAHTELASALDMLRAAEQESDPTLRRLFHRHALDEFRHADAFRNAANAIEQEDASVDAEALDVVPLTAARDHLYDDMGRTRFLAFVHLAEKDGQAHFAALHRFFSKRNRDDADRHLSALFARVEKDERFHVAYSKRALTKGPHAIAPGRWRRLVLSILFERGRSQWLQAGAQLGTLLAGALMLALFVVVLPFFALVQRWVERPNTGWILPGALPTLAKPKATALPAPVFAPTPKRGLS